MKRGFTDALWPVVCFWARRHESAILRAGAPLVGEELAQARLAGVRHPERVRTLVVDSVPPRIPRGLRKIASRLHWGPTTTAGMALGYGIYLRADQVKRRDLLLHELVHTAQYERLGFRPFLRAYLHECLTAGYPSGALEIEARQVASDTRGGRKEL